MPSSLPHPPDRRAVLALAARAVFASLLPAGLAQAATATRRPDGKAGRRIEALLARMTLEEMAGQLNAEGAWSPRLALSDFFAANPFMPPVSPDEGRRLHASQLERVRAGATGVLMGLMDVDTAEQAQRAAVRETRLGIPLLFAADIIHGHRTCFPIPLAEAASWEPELARRTARAAAVEATRIGLDMTFAPMVDIGCDQRWGRVAEGAGEDVLLGCRFAAARVRGFQGDDPAAPDSLLACPKHFAGYGAVEAGRDYAGADITERVLHEVYLPPFRAAYEAGAIATMSSFNTVDGVPATGNRHLLTELLRGELGFRGAVISDFSSERELVAHGFAADERDAVRLAVTAGCDIGMGTGLYLRWLPALVREGRLGRAVLVEAVRRLLWVKAAAGLFDDPFRRIDPRRAQDRSSDDAHRALARDAAARSIVLLKNDGELLPLRPAHRRIALVGPFARDTANLNGPWGPLHVRVEPVALADGLRAALGSGQALEVVDGAGVESPLPGGLDAAEAAARRADVVVLAIGESQDMSGEAASRARIEIPAAQQALAEAVAATGTPVVIVLRHGRALALQGAVRDARAIVAGWFLGTETGAALADVLTGRVNPGGRLPVSFPLASGQSPFHYARASGGRPAPASEPLAPFTSHYRGVPDAALFAFGHGLGYARIDYDAPHLGATTLDWDGTLELAVTVVNRGAVAADEVVQLYVHDVVASVAQPVRRLVGFEKLRLEPDERRRVRFHLRRDDLAFVGRDLVRRAEPGDFDVWIAPSSTAGSAMRFTLLPPAAAAAASRAVHRGGASG